MKDSDNDASKRREMEARLERLERICCGLAESGSIGNALGHGIDAIGRVSDRLEDIAAQLTPLRRLEGSAPALDEKQQALLQRLVASLDRTDFSDVRSLPARESPVPFIGDLWEHAEAAGYLSDRSTST